MKRMLLGASAVIALSAGHAVRADDDYHFHDGNKNPSISYVRNSLAQSVILNGPWTLHKSVANFIHDASGIVPPASSNGSALYRDGHALCELLQRGRPVRGQSRLQLDAALLFPLRAPARRHP